MNSRKAASAPLLSTPLSPTSLACCTTSLDRCLWYNRRPALPCPDRSPEPVARWHGTRRVRLRTRRRKGTGPDKDGARTERKGLDDVGAAAEAAIDHDGDIACLFQDASQRLHRRDSVVQLSAAMICEDDPVHAAISCQGSVCGREDALDDQRCLPQTAYQPDVAPAQSLMWGNTGNLSREQPWSAPRFQIVDMRILPLHKDACEYRMPASAGASQHPSSTSVRAESESRSPPARIAPGHFFERDDRIRAEDKGNASVRRRVGHRGMALVRDERAAAQWRGIPNGVA